MKQVDELANIRSILKEKKLKYSENEGKKSFTFEIEKRNIKVLVNEKNKVEARILDYDGLNPLCHIQNIKIIKEGRMCLDNQINAYEVESFKKKYINSIKEIILEENFLEDSFNELEINIEKKEYLKAFHNVLRKKSILFFGFKWLSLNKKKYLSYKELNKNNFQIVKLKWDGRRFRNMVELKKAYINEKINWSRDNLFIFEYLGREKWIFAPRDYDQLAFIINLYHSQTMIHKTGTKIKKNDLITIIGLGSLGSELFERLRLAGYENFILIDPKNLQSNNEYRWAYPTFILDISLNKPKVNLIKRYFPYLNITSFNKKVENIKINKLNISNDKIKNLIFINATAKDIIDKETFQLWLNISKNKSFEKSVYKLSFLEENGLALHTFSINYEKNNSNYNTYQNELNKFTANWKLWMILKQNKKYIYQQGCIGETQIYTQNSVKKLTINASHIWNDNYDEYTKINLLPKLVRKKKEEWTDYYRDYTKKNNCEYNEEIEIE